LSSPIIGEPLFLVADDQADALHPKSPRRYLHPEWTRSRHPKLGDGDQQLWGHNYGQLWGHIELRRFWRTPI